MNYTKFITTILFTALIVAYCQSQNQPVPPKIEQALKALYPQAANTLWADSPVNSNTRQVIFECNCTEGLGHLKITFDTVGTVLTKEVDISMKELPVAITDYVDNNYPSSGFTYGETAKVSGNTNDVTYRVELLQINGDGNVTVGGWVYILKFKASGEFISVDKRLQNN